MAFAVGVGAIFLPLSGIPFFVMGGALLAAESLPLAQFLDRSERRFQRGWEKFKGRSGLPPSAVRLLVLAVPVGLLALSSSYCYYVFSR